MNKKTSGFTLIEVVVVIAILGILAGIAVPRWTGYTKLAEERVCSSNRSAVERLYHAFLLENDHTDGTFSQFLLEKFDVVCPKGGLISYEDGWVKCSIHEEISEDHEEPPGDEVPWI